MIFLGKSFFLNLLLRHLIYKSDANNYENPWTNYCETIGGFQYESRPESVTYGILIWPKPIITYYEQLGERVAIHVMDTQGLFDPRRIWMEILFFILKMSLKIFIVTSLR